MTLAATAWGHDGLSFSGKDMRFLVDAMYQQSGVVGDTDMLVSQQASPGNTVSIAAGLIVVTATAAGLGGKYSFWNDFAQNSPAFTPTSTNGRKDRLIVRVTAGVPAFEIVQGVASGSPVEPTITGDNFEELALITLPASTSNITTAMITDRRNHATARGATMRARGTNYPYPLYSARLYRSAALTLATGANTVLPFDAEDWDYNNNAATGASAQYVAPVTGNYDVFAQLRQDANANPDIIGWAIFVNAAARLDGGQTYRGVTTGDDILHRVQGTIKLNAGDVVDARYLITTNTRGALVGPLSTFFEISKQA